MQQIKAHHSTQKENNPYCHDLRDKQVKPTTCVIGSGTKTIKDPKSFVTFCPKLHHNYEVLRLEFHCKVVVTFCAADRLNQLNYLSILFLIFSIRYNYLHL